MRIQYTYQKYSNCPRATEYSRSAESSAAYGGMFIELLSFGAIITFLICTFSFFGNYNWGDFLGGVAFIIAMSLLDFYYFVIRPNNIACEIKVILTEDGNHNLPQDVVQEYCESLRKENRKQNKKEFNAFYPIFLAIFFDVIALIAGIKGVYFLCHKEEGIFLLLASIIALCVFSFLIWRFIKGPAPIARTQNTVVDRLLVNPSTPSNNEIAFCRKCGAKILPDSTFCSKCGTQVR